MYATLSCLYNTTAEVTQWNSLQRQLAAAGDHHLVHLADHFLLYFPQIYARPLLTVREAIIANTSPRGTA